MFLPLRTDERTIRDLHAARHGICSHAWAIWMTTAVDKPWYVYLVRAENGSLYCGISDDAQRRFAAHLSGRGARFFHSSPAVALVYVEPCATKGDALRRERAIKKLKKSAKETLVSMQSGPVSVNMQTIS